MRKGRGRIEPTLRHHVRASVSLAAGTLAGVFAAVTAAAASPPPPAPAAPSAIGDESVQSVAVSPAYLHTGTVAVASSAGSCSGNPCMHLWITHDRGVTWQRRAARDWQGGPLTAAVTGDGREVLFSTGPSALQRSDDGGDSFTTAGAAGIPTISPTFAADGAVAVAGGSSHDYVVDQHGSHPVQGSGGSLVDSSFLLSPSFPGSGSYQPALLGAFDSHSGAAFVLRCTAQLSCSTPVPVFGSQKLPSGLTLVPSPAYASDGMLFANSKQSLYRSSDGGTSFTPVNVGQVGALATATSDVTFGPSSGQSGGDGVAYVAVLQLFKDVHRPTSGGVYRSSDDGATWSVLGSPNPLDEGATALGVAPDGRIFAGYARYQSGVASGLLCWAGSSWSATCGGPPVGPNTSSSCGAAHCAPPAATAAPLSGAAANATPGPGNAGTPSGGSGGGDAALAGAPQGSSGARRILALAALVVAVALGGAAAVSLVARRRRLTAP